eukprot:4737887-Lingulodinium_polyedra.AAC.1
MPRSLMREAITPVCRAPVPLALFMARVKACATLKPKVVASSGDNSVKEAAALATILEFNLRLDDPTARKKLLNPSTSSSDVSLFHSPMEIRLA